jgi:polysaccharide chain length determinant protein (PEP-CTERM system associated)
MAEVYETEASKEKVDFARYIDVARRRHMYFLVPLLLAWLLVWGVSWVLAPRYKSSTQILVSEPTMSKNYVVPNVDDDLQARLQSMQQQILSRTRLLMIIDSMHLYGSGGRKPMTDEEKVTQMRKEIAIDLVRDAQNGGITGFKIDYSAQNPRVAQQVTGQLAGLFINENQQNLLKESGDTTKFLEVELAKASADLATMDAKKKAFEATHVGTLPTQEASNLQILTGLQAQLTNEQDAVNNATQQRALHQTMIQQLRTNPTPVPRSAVVDPNSVEAFDILLGKLRDQLTDLRSRYTDSYPDVIKLRVEIAQTEKQRDAAVAAEKAKGDKLAGVDSLTLAQLEAQLKSDEVEIANRKTSIAGLQARIAEYEGRINAEPASEQQLADINRGYEQSQANYNDLLKKKQDSQMATNMEENLQGERFTLLDPPSLPTKPDFPNRLEFCAAGLLVGLALGSFSVIAFELTDDRLHNEADIKDLLPVAVICEVPEVSNPSDELVSKRKAFIGWATAAAVIVIILAGSAVSYLHG